MTETKTSSQGEIGLLDILVVIAESWIVILVGTLAAAVVGFVFATVQPVEYRAEARIALAAAEVQAAVAESPTFQQMQADGSLSLSGAGDAAVTTIVIMSNSREALGTVQSEVEEALDRVAQTFIDTNQDQVEAQIAQSEQRMSEINSALNRVNPTILQIEESGDVSGEAYSQLLALGQQLEAERYALVATVTAQETTLAQLPSDTTSILTAFTQSSSRRSPVLVAIVSGFAAGFVLLIWVFVRQGLRAASFDTDGRQKLDRIKRAFSLSRTR